MDYSCKLKEPFSSQAAFGHGDYLSNKTQLIHVRLGYKYPSQLSGPYCVKVGEAFHCFCGLVGEVFHCFSSY